MPSDSIVERNVEMCRLYVSGQTLQSIADQFGITRERVRQILRKAGVFKADRQTAGRDQFIGVNVTEPTKDALKIEAEKRGTSVSRLASDTLDEMLDKL